MFFENIVWDILARAFILSSLALIWVIFTVRIVGLRSFSKMAAFDFAVTIAVGSLLAQAVTASAWDKFAMPLAAISALLFVQAVVAQLRVHSSLFAGLVDNQPTLLWLDGGFIEGSLTKTRVTKSDVIAKLREANALRQVDVRAVVLETTGDISVLHGDNVDDRLLDNLSSK